jgi:hypothetical protein
MLARPTLNKPSDPEGANKPKGQPRPTEERFLLRVDGQIKGSFAEKEVAIKAGGVIKKMFPVVVVMVEDTEEGSREIISAQQS